MEVAALHNEKKYFEWVLVFAAMVIIALLWYPSILSQPTGRLQKSAKQLKRHLHPAPADVQTVTPIVYLRSV